MCAPTKVCILGILEFLMVKLSEKDVKKSSNNLFKPVIAVIPYVKRDSDSITHTNPYHFITMNEQRFHSANKPLRLTSPIILDKAHFATCSEIYSSACESLFYNFINRKVMLVSEGKTKNGFSPFRKISGDSKYFGQALAESTHLTFTINFTDKFGEATEIYPVIIIDIDDFNGDFSIFKKLNIEPNYLISNPQKSKSLQVGYVLSEPIFKKKRMSFYDYEEYDKHHNLLPIDKQPVELKFYMIRNKLNELLNGDFNFKLHNAKNPFAATHVGSIAWTNLAPYNIENLFNKVFSDEKEQEINFDDIENHILTETDENKHYKFNKKSRNCALFNEMRLLAYEISSEYIEANDPKAFFNYLFDTADVKNYHIGLPLNEIKAMIRSIVKYCFRNKVSCKYPSYQKRRLDKMSKVKNDMIDTYGIDHKYSKSEKEFLAKKYNISIKTLTVYISQIRKENGYNENKNQLINEIKALRKANTKWARIAEIFGKKESTLKLMYKRHIESEQSQCQ